MAATSDDILTIAELKTHLRLPAAHTSEDEFLQQIISQAIDTAARDSGLPLLDRPFTAFADFPKADDEPVVVAERFFKFDVSDAKHDIDYWTAAGSLADDPDGSISRADITRTITAGAGGACLLLYSKSGWPTDAAPRTRLRVVGTKGGVDPVPFGLKAAIIILARFLYSGNDKFPDRSAYDRLLAPHRRRTLP